MTTRRNSVRTGRGLRVIVFGFIVRGPLGGFAWHHLQYVLGLAGLGHDVYFLEDSGDSPWCCYDPERSITDADPAYGLRFTQQAFGGVGLGDCWAYYDAHAARWHGPCANRALEICATADLFLNLDNTASLRPWFQEIPARVLIDTDPVFGQVRYLTHPEAHAVAGQHTAFLSFGENVGRPGCVIPEDGFPWRATRQPVVLDAWPVTAGPGRGMFTTVMQWDSYPACEYNGRRYGMKSDSFGPYLDLPARAGSVLELALGSESAPRALLRDKGWAVRDPREPTRDLWTYQEYLRQSRAEFGIAKHGYVVSRSGWFSERSTAYLASGRPVLVQETGFSDWLPTGAGVLSFNNPEEALAGIEAINSRYEFHCRAARDIAAEYFEAGKVLTRLIDAVMG
jgi:hypothetical protein